MKNKIWNIRVSNNGDYFFFMCLSNMCKCYFSLYLSLTKRVHQKSYPLCFGKTSEFWKIAKHVTKAWVGSLHLVNRIRALRIGRQVCLNLLIKIVTPNCDIILGFLGTIYYRIPNGKSFKKSQHYWCLILISYNVI